MKPVDLSKYNLAELKGLQHEIEQQIKSRQHQDVRKAREQILSIAQSLGISIDELLQSSAGKGKGGTGQKVQPQYHHPDDASLTWTGRGRQPRWVVDALANGKTLDELRI